MAFDSNQASKGLIILFGLMLGVIMAVSVVTNPAGGLAALIPLITITLAILALVKPRAGLFALVPLVIWVDEFKRLAVYFGGANSMTVIQTLAMPFVVLAALNSGFLVHALFGRVKLDKIGFFFYALAAMAGGGVFVTMDASLAERAQRAANIAGYLTLIPIAYTYLRTLDEWRSFFGFQVIFALPAAAWAIKQYYFGFDQIEWTYARSGLSRVHASQMFGFLNPRVFGFFGSASSLGCCAIYCAFSWWHAYRFRGKRLFWIFASLLLTWVLVVSTQRTILVYPLIVFAGAWVFRTRARLLLAYTTGFAAFVLAVVYSDWLLEVGIEKINNAIATDTEWGSNVLKVSTFSDRIRGWQRLKRAESWTLIGTGGERVSAAGPAIDLNSDDYNHDVINKVLINVGALGLIVILIPGGFILYTLHRVPLTTPNRQERNDAAFVLALALPMVGLSMIGGDNFNANPINMQIWTSFSGVLVCRTQSMITRRKLREQAAAAPAPVLVVAAPRSRVRQIGSAAG